MNCEICHKEVVLSPSASERAAKFGGPPSFYTGLFRTHTSCALQKRHDDTIALMRSKTREQHLAEKVREYGR